MSNQAPQTTCPASVAWTLDFCAHQLWKPNRRKKENNCTNGQPHKSPKDLVIARPWQFSDS